MKQNLVAALQPVSTWNKQLQFQNVKYINKQILLSKAKILVFRRRELRTIFLLVLIRFLS